MSYDVWLAVDVGGSEPLSVGDLRWNYTSNVAPMWRKAMPETDGLAGMDGMTAKDAAVVLAKGIAAMRSEPDVYRAMNPENGWGDYHGQLRALCELLDAFNRAPLATVQVSR